MTNPLPPEREGSTRQRRAGEGLSPRGLSDNAYERRPTERSRDLRNNATPAERKLWNAISSHKLCGVRFNRQVVIRPFICDFVARSEKLVIELDGGQHGNATAYDEARTKFLEKGYRILRFWNNDVLENIESVVRRIESALNDRPSPSRLRRSSPPAPAGGA